MRYARSWARVRCRVGIACLRLGPPACGASGILSVSVGVASYGKNRAPCGLVMYRRPEGETKTIVPSGICRSRQPSGPVKKVLIRWWDQIGKSTLSHLAARQTHASRHRIYFAAKIPTLREPNAAESDNDRSQELEATDDCWHPERHGVHPNNDRSDRAKSQ